MTLMLDFAKIYSEDDPADSADILLTWAADMMRVAHVALMNVNGQPDNSEELNYAVAGLLEVATALVMRGDEGCDMLKRFPRIAKRDQPAGDAA